MRKAVFESVVKAVRFVLFLVLSLAIFLACLCVCLGSEPIKASDRGDDPELYGGD